MHLVEISIKHHISTGTRREYNCKIWKLTCL